MTSEETRIKLPFGLSMLGWALNEELSIVDYIDRAGRYLSNLTDDYELVLLSDGSTDRTWELMCRCQASRPWLKVFQNDRNRGPGYSTRRAISLAQKDYVFWQTVDWSYDIELLGKNFELLTKYDVLQGVRLNSLSLRGVFANRSDTAGKGLVSILNYFLIRTLFRLPLSDYQNVTVYSRRLIQDAVLESCSSFTNPECLLKTWWKGASFKEIPVGFLKRERGEAKGTKPMAILASVADIIYWWVRWVVLRRRSDFGRGKVTYWTGVDTAKKKGRANESLNVGAL